MRWGSPHAVLTSLLGVEGAHFFGALLQDFFIDKHTASVYNRVLNYVLNHELNKNDSQLLEVNLLNQLKLAKRVNLFDYSLEELQAVHEYWRSMNRYSKQVLNKEKVA